MRTLFHRILPEKHMLHTPPSEVLEIGISNQTKSNQYYMNVGVNRNEILEKLRPSSTPSWLKFDEAISCDFEVKGKKSFSFPIFSDRIVVFNADIVSEIYDQEFCDTNSDRFEEAVDFDTGKDIQYLYKMYWESLINFEEYCKNEVYGNPQILLFEAVPCDIIEIVTK